MRLSIKRKLTTKMSSQEFLVSTLRANEAELRSAGIRSLFIFGSVSREEERPDSDVDIAVELDPDAHLSLFRFIGLEHRLALLLGRQVQLMPEPTANSRLLANVLKDRRRVF